jgi:hypothetical protein
MDLVRDILDKQLLDRNRIKMGKVDGILLEVPDGKPPRLAALEVGGITLARRLHPRLGEWIASWRERHDSVQRAAYRIPWTHVRDIGIDIEVELNAEQTPVLAWEYWLRDHVIRRIPGSG